MRLSFPRAFIVRHFRYFHSTKIWENLLTPDLNSFYAYKNNNDIIINNHRYDLNKLTRNMIGNMCCGFRTVNLKIIIICVVFTQSHKQNLNEPNLIACNACKHRVLHLVHSHSNVLVYAITKWIENRRFSHE